MIKLPAQVGILVVDDDVAIRRLMKMVLEREGYRVEQAADGLEAVLKLGLSDFDVIVPSDAISDTEIEATQAVLRSTERFHGFVTTTDELVAALK